jgi:hypothetical protein
MTPDIRIRVNLLYNSLSNGQILPHIHMTYFHMTFLMTYSLFPPFLGGGAGKILGWPCPHPIYSCGVGLGAWLAGSSLVLRPC